jgi:hypothetical protein
MKVTFFFFLFFWGGVETTQIEANWKEEKRSLFPFFTFLVLLS